MCSVTVMVEMAARAAKHVMFADKANAQNFHRKTGETFFSINDIRDDDDDD